MGRGRMEKGVDQVIGVRQQHKGMSWNPTGSKALGISKWWNFTNSGNRCGSPSRLPHSCKSSPINLQEENDSNRTERRGKSAAMTFCWIPASLLSARCPVDGVEEERPRGAKCA